MRDLTNTTQNDDVLRLATRLLNEHGSAIGAVDQSLFGPATAETDPVHLEALRVAHSRQQLIEAAATGPITLSVVWAMYAETSRMRPAGPDNPHGEDFFRQKVAQIRWLTDGLDVEWHLIAVDDGCPDDPNSATEARALIEAEGWGSEGGERVSVLELADVVGQEAPAAPVEGLSTAFANLGSTGDSLKGGSILYGLWHALNSSTSVEGERHHVVIYTDADLSTNLGQCGLLVAPIVTGKASAVVGQRYGIDGAVLVTARRASCEPISTGSKPDKMIVLFRHFVRATLIPDIAHLLDTQAGFKAFDARSLAAVIAAMESFDETFDVELLIRFVRHVANDGRPGLAITPIVFVEGFAQSNFPSVDPGQRHLDMVLQLVDIYQRLVAPNAAVAEPEAEAEQLLPWLKGLDLDRYVQIIEGLRAADADREQSGVADPLFAARWTIAELSPSS